MHKIYLGGGFGRRGAHDYVRQAVLIAKEMPGTPVKLIWSREEDMQHGAYHPVTMAKLIGGLDANGNLTGLHIRLSGQSIIAHVLPQNLQNGKDPVAFQGLLPSGEHAFGYTIAEPADRPRDAQPACAAGLLARRQHQPQRDLRRMLHGRAGACGRPGSARVPAQADEQASRSIWRCSTRSPRRSTGASRRRRASTAASPHFMGYGSYVAAVAEVSVSGNKVKIHRIVASTDPGYAVNPAQIERQIAGSFVYGLSALLYRECTVKDGRIEQANFDTYNSMRIGEMPKVEIVLVPSGGFWGGVGEPTICVAAPAVLNAIFAATGKRIRTLPLSNHDSGDQDGAMSQSGGGEAAALPIWRLQHEHDARVRRRMAFAGGLRRPPPTRRRGRGVLLGLSRRERRASRRRCRGSSAATRPRSSAAMTAFRPASSAATVMDRIAKGFSDDEIRAIAPWYAAQQ